MGRLGVRVIGIDEKPGLAGISDPRIAECAIGTFSKEIALRLDTSVRIDRDGELFRLRMADESPTVERVLAALGRKPELAALALDAAGVSWNEDGDAPIDAVTLRLADTTIFVAGDASANRPLLHEAVDEGVIAARGALARLSGMQADLPPRRTPLDIVFTDPDVVKIGMHFDALSPDAVTIGTADGTGNGRSAITDTQANLVRVYADRKDGTLLGAAAISAAGEHLGHPLALAISHGLSASGMLAMPFYHPTFEELVQGALRDIVEQQGAR